MGLQGSALTDRGFPLGAARKAAGRGAGWAGASWDRPRLPHLTPSQGENPGADPRPGSRGRFPTCLGVPIDSCQIRSDGENSCKCEPGRIRLGFLVSPSPLHRSGMAPVSRGLQRFWGQGSWNLPTSLAAEAAMPSSSLSSGLN